MVPKLRGAAVGLLAISSAIGCQRFSATEVPSDSNKVALVNNSGQTCHVCVVDVDGFVRCWGHGEPLRVPDELAPPD